MPQTRVLHKVARKKEGEPELTGQSRAAQQCWSKMKERGERWERIPARLIPSQSQAPFCKRLEAGERIVDLFPFSGRITFALLLFFSLHSHTLYKLMKHLQDLFSSVFFLFRNSAWPPCLQGKRAVTGSTIKIGFIGILADKSVLIKLEENCCLSLSKLGAHTE